VAAPPGSGDWCDAGAVSPAPYGQAAFVVLPYPAGVLQEPSQLLRPLPNGFTGTQGTHRVAARSVRPVPRTPLRRGTPECVTRMSGTRRGRGVLVWGVTASAVPGGPGTPARVAGWLKGCCSGMGTAGGRAQLGVSPGHPSGSG